MINVLIKKKDNQIINLKVTGHANSDVYGKDLDVYKRQILK